MREVRGAIHLHSKYSDGSGTVGEIVQAASDAGLDFVILTDHDSLEARRDGWEGWHGDVLLAIGVEITPKRGGHVVALNVEEVDGYTYLPEEEIVRRVRAQGGLAFVVHPEGKRRLDIGVNLKRWQNWHLGDFQGLEIWSFMHDWAEKFRWWKVRDFYRAPYSKITGPDLKLLEVWDRLCKKRKVSAFAGLDAHAKPLFLTRYKFLPYERILDTTLTYVLVDDWSRDDKEDVRRLYSALQEGRAFVAYDHDLAARGFRFYAETETGRYEMGESVPPGLVCAFHVILPEAARISVKKDGNGLLSKYGSTFDFQTHDRGVYRVEVFRENRPWIFSNPIYVGL